MRCGAPVADAGFLVSRKCRVCSATARRTSFRLHRSSPLTTVKLPALVRAVDWACLERYRALVAAQPIDYML